MTLLRGLLLFITLLATTAHGQTKYCCYPDQWESHAGLLAGSADDEGHTAITTGRIHVSVDSTGKRIRSVVSIDDRSMKKTYTILQLYQQNVQYVIENTTCTHSTLGQWDNNNCVPDNATVMSKYRLGLQGNMQVTQYDWTVGTLNVTITVSSDSCTPIAEGVYGNVQGVNTMSGIGFHAVTTGIKDPHVFDIPEICKGSLLAEGRRLSTMLLERKTVTKKCFGVL